MSRRGSCLLLCFIIVISIVISGVQAKNLTYASDYYTHGNDCADQGKYEEALQAFRTARSMDEIFYDEHYGISYQIGWVLNKLGRYEEALQEFEKAEKYHPEWIYSHAIYYNKGVLLAKLGRNEEAIQAFDTSLKYFYWNWFVWFNKGCVLAKMGRYQDAATAFDNSRYSTRFPLLGSFREASATYDRAHSINSPFADTLSQESILTTGPASVSSALYAQETSVTLLMAKGDDFLVRRQYEDAITVYDRVIALDPGNYKAMEAKGEALAMLGRYAESLPLLNQSIKYMDWRVDEGSYLNAYDIKGWVLAQMRDYDGAINAFDIVFIVSPDWFRTHYNKAWVLAKQGKYNEAVSEYNHSLDWENQIRVEHKSWSILGPLGTFQDAAEAYNRASGARPYITQAPLTLSKEILLYQADFSSDPHWRTSNTRQYYWDQVNQTYNFRSDASLCFAEMLIPYNGTAFRLEYDITIPHADPGSLLRFGLSQYNRTYNSQNTVLGEFKSWRAGQYPGIKDGTKSFMVFTIDSTKHASDPEYDGLCFLNKEEAIANPTFGNNRIYHVVMIFDPDKQTISYQVSDNLHVMTDFQCAWVNHEVGTFQNMNRIILVAEQGENAYIEGSIDNVELYQIESTPAPLAVSLQGSEVPTTTEIPITTEQVQNQTPRLPPPEQISNRGTPDNSGSLGMVILIGIIMGGIGIYAVSKFRKKSTEQKVEQRTVIPKKIGEPPAGTDVPARKEDMKHHEVFICYSTTDKPVADNVCAQLESHAIRCWMAPRDVFPGENFPESIIKAIEESRIMVLIFSSHANSSPHVIRELTKAVTDGLIVIQFRIEDAPLSKSMEYLIGISQYLDARSPPLEQHIETLVNTVDLLLKKNLK